MNTFLAPIESLGDVWHCENPELTKRYFREHVGARRTHIHVRRFGRHEQYALLFRDYVRTHIESRQRYERSSEIWQRNSEGERAKYTNAKAPILWEIMQKADRWAAGLPKRDGRQDRATRRRAAVLGRTSAVTGAMW